MTIRASPLVAGPFSPLPRTHPNQCRPALTTSGHARFAAAAFAVASSVLPAPVLATKPDGTCPATASGYVRVDRAGWWDRTVAGKNANGFLCIKDLPNTPGSPGYLFGVTDDTSSARR